MSVKLKSTSAKTEAVAADIDRPFDPAVLRRAEELAAQYQVIMWFEDGEYYGRGLELPGAMGDGKTPTECMEATREAFVVGIAHLIETGRTPPTPAGDGARTEQVNIRVSREEKLQLEELARQYGHRGVADYLRAVGLAPQGRPAAAAAPRVKAGGMMIASGRRSR